MDIRVTDEETGLYYLNARWYYEPEVGRWISPDSTDVMLEHLDDSLLATNLYTYCLNNPIMLIDRNGNSPTVWDWLWNGALIVGGAGSMVGGWGAISTGISLLAFGPVGIVAGIALIAVGAGTMIFGANDIATAITGTNHIQQMTGMSDRAYGWTRFGLNAASSFGSFAGQMRIKSIRVNALKGVENASYGQKLLHILVKGLIMALF